MLIDLMERKNNGIEVTLYWEDDENLRQNDGLYLKVSDAGSEEDDWLVPIPAAEAMEAFEHPYMYQTPSFVPTTDDPDCPTFS